MAWTKTQPQTCMNAHTFSQTKQCCPSLAHPLPPAPSPHLSRGVTSAGVSEKRSEEVTRRRPPSPGIWRGRRA